MVDEDSMEISSEHGHNGEDIDIDIDLSTAGPFDEDDILDDADAQVTFDTTFDDHPAADDPMLDEDEHYSVDMEDAHSLQGQHDDQLVDSMTYTEVQALTDQVHIETSHTADAIFTTDDTAHTDWEPPSVHQENISQDGQSIAQYDAEVTRTKAENYENVDENLDVYYDNDQQDLEGQYTTTEAGQYEEDTQQELGVYLGSADGGVYENDRPDSDSQYAGAGPEVHKSQEGLEARSETTEDIGRHDNEEEHLASQPGATDLGARVDNQQVYEGQDVTTRDSVNNQAEFSELSEARDQFKDEASAETIGTSDPGQTPNGLQGDTHGVTEQQQEILEPVAQPSPEASGAQSSNSPTVLTPLASDLGDNPLEDDLNHRNEQLNLASGHEDGNDNSSYHHDYDNEELRNIKAWYNGVEFSLFALSGESDPDTYFIQDLAIADEPLAAFFEVLRKAINHEMSSEDEICIQFHTLDLVIEEYSSFGFGDHTFGQIFQLYQKLRKNDDPGSDCPLEIEVCSKPSFSKRLASIISHAGEGLGLNALTADELTGSPVEGELVEVAFAIEDGFEASFELPNDDDNLYDDETNAQAEDSEIRGPDSVATEQDAADPGDLVTKTEAVKKSLAENPRNEETAAYVAPEISAADGGGSIDEGDLIGYEDEENGDLQKSEERQSSNAAEGAQSGMIDKPSQVSAPVLQDSKAFEPIAGTKYNVDDTSEEVVDGDDTIDYTEYEQGEYGDDVDVPQTGDLIQQHETGDHAAEAGTAEEGDLSAEQVEYEPAETSTAYDNSFSGLAASAQEGVDVHEAQNLYDDEIGYDEDIESNLATKNLELEEIVGEEQAHELDVHAQHLPAQNGPDHDDAGDSDATLNHDFDEGNNPQPSLHDLRPAKNEKDEIDYDDDGYDDNPTAAEPQYIVDIKEPHASSNGQGQGQGKRPRAEADFEDASSTIRNDAKRARP